MAMYKVRRLLQALGGTKFGSSTNYTGISTSGYQTQVGTARTYKEIWVPATNFGVYSSSAASSVTSACGNVALTNKNLSMSGSIFSGCQSASILIPMLTATGASGAVGASMLYATATLPRPLDADTSGCINVRLVWTWSSITDAVPLTSNSCFSFKAGMAYIADAASMRSAASCGAAASYGGATSTSSLFHEVSLGNLPSWGAANLVGVLTVGVDGSIAASNTGGSSWGILGAKLRYVANSLGTQTS